MFVRLAVDLYTLRPVLLRRKEFIGVGRNMALLATELYAHSQRRSLSKYSKYE